MPTDPRHNAADVLAEEAEKVLQGLYDRDALQRALTAYWRTIDYPEKDSQPVGDTPDPEIPVVMFG